MKFLRTFLIILGLVFVVGCGEKPVDESSKFWLKEKKEELYRKLTEKAGVELCPSYAGPRAPDSHYYRAPDGSCSNYYIKYDSYGFRVGYGYQRNLSMPEVDIDTFMVTGDDLANDKNNKYYKNEVVNEASKTPMKDYVEDYLKRNKGCYPYTFRLNNSDGGSVYLNVDMEYGPANFSCCYEGGSSSCVSRSDESLIRSLEKNLNEKFNLNKGLVFKYNNQIAYSDDKYVNETAVKSLSPDGRYAELDFPMGGPGPFPRCYFFDMQEGSCISPIDINALEGSYDEIMAQVDIERQKLAKEKGVNEYFDKSLGFYDEELAFNDEVTIYGKRIPTGELNFEWTNVNYRHIPTGEELSIYVGSRINQEDKFLGLYGHHDMLGLVLLTYWRWEAEDIVSMHILPQNLLDEKLAQLYNNVAMHYYGEKDYNQAIRYFEKAIEINNEYAQAYFNKGSAHSLMGHIDEAINALKKAIEIEPEKFIEKAKADPDFDGIRENAQFIGLIGE